jgi:prepilin peptidase CpaA
MLEPSDALILLVPVLPIAIWAAVSDLKRMKIPNTAVIAMAAVWPLIGWYLVPLESWLWGFAIMAIVFVAGFLMYLTGTFGAGMPSTPRRCPASSSGATSERSC